MDFSEQKDFEINTASLREIRAFSRNIFECELYAILYNADLFSP